MTRASPARRRRRLFYRAVTLAGAAAGLATSFARADTQAINVTSVGSYPPLTANGFNYYQSPGGYTFTWNFKVNSPIQVTQLGYYDSSLTGTGEPQAFGSHLVTLSVLSADGPLAQTTVNASDPATGVFRYGTITPVALDTADTYVLSGTMTNQYYLVGLNQSAAPTAPQVSYLFNNDGNIFGGTPPAGTYGDFGPNFQFVTAASCSENVSGRDIIALTGDKCTAAPNTYRPTTTSVTLPVAYNGFGFYANGGAIDSPGDVSIATADPDSTGGRHAVWAQGTNSLITLEGSTGITTAGKGSFGVFASAGGQVTSTGALSVTTDGANSFALYAIGSGSKIDAVLGALRTTAAVTPAVVALNGATILLSGGTVDTTGNGASGLLADGAGTTLNATGVKLTVRGGVDEASGAAAVGALARNGAAISLIDSAILTTGVGVAGVEAQRATIDISGGSVNAAGDQSVALRAIGANANITAGSDNKAPLSLAIGGANSTGVQVQNGGAVTVGSANAPATLTASGPNSQLYFATGTGSRINATNVTAKVEGGFRGGSAAVADQGAVLSLTNGSVVTDAGFAQAVTAQNQASALLNGTAVTATGGGSVGLWAAQGGSIQASGVTVNVSGGVDGTSGVSSGGASNDGYGSAPAGGILQLNASSITVTGASGYGVLTADGGITTLVASAVETKGANGAGVESGANGQTILQGGSVATGGAGAPALLATGVGAMLTSQLQNGVGLTVTTRGDNASGAEASGGGQITLVGGSVSTSGSGSLGLYAHGSGSSLHATDVSVATTGAGVANAILATNGGMVTMTGGATSTQGLDAYVAAVGGGSSLTLTGTSLSASGAGAGGVAINGANALFQGDGLTINVKSGYDAVNNLLPVGVGNQGFGAQGSGGAVKLSGSSVTMSADGAIGVYTADGGTSTLTANQIRMTGANAVGVDSGAGGQVQIHGGSIETTEDNALGLVATSRLGAGQGGSPGQIIADLYNGAGLTITTGGQNAHAVAVYQGGGVSLSGATLTTSGINSFGLLSSGANSTLTANGVTVTTSGAGAFGASVVGAGAMTLNQGVSLATTGAGAHGLYVSGSGSTATIDGAVSVAATGANAAAVYVDGGAGVAAKGALTLTSGANGVFVNGLTTSAAAPTAFAASAPLTITTTSGAGVTLAGNQAQFSAVAGGILKTQGPGLAFLNGQGQVATLVNFDIETPSGDLIFADPANAVANFAQTTANAGNGNLIDATNGSNLVVNADASTLTGAAQTAAGSISSIFLNKGSSWTVTGNSNVTSLSVTDSTVSFSAPVNGAFKTLTVQSYTGANSTLTLNAALGAAMPQADQLVINGGRATGATRIAINTVGPTSRPAGAGPATISVPIVTATNGGSIAPGAFSLSGPVTVGGYLYTLQQESGGEYLVSTQGLSNAQATSSLATLASAKQTQAVTSRVLGSILTGATEQVNCSSCSSGFASFGSFALGLHGRWTLSPSVALLAGGSYDSYSSRGVTVNNSIQLAAALRYDMVQLGHYRPFFEAGLAVSPYANVTYRRTYTSSAGDATSVGSALSRSVAVYGRAGYIWRVTPRDEAAIYTDLSRSWQSTGGYIEGATGGNPFGAIVLPSLDTMNVWRAGAQYTHLFGQHIEANVSAGFAEAFGANYGSAAEISGFGSAGASAPSSFDWVELGGRLSYRFSKNVVADAFALGTLGAEPAGKQIHGGVALRMAF